MANKVYINVGHSDTDPGAVGFEVERELAVKVSNYQRDHLLANYICEVRMNPGTMGNLNAIAADANSWGADLFVSNHFNAGKGDGYEALIYNELRRELGELFDKFVKKIGQNSRGVKLRPDLAVLRLTNMPAVLNEGAFVDNKKDIEDWNEDHELKKLGIAYAEACAEFLKLKKKSKDKVETATIVLPVLSYGMKGDSSVKSMQFLLNMLGYKVSPTGNFGDGTKSAVMKAQKAYGIPVTGKCDAQTWNKILGM